MANSNTRTSNLELMRIVVMLMIVCHHYVVNSGVWDLLSIADSPAKTVFLQVFGLFGKPGINAFVLITGYFMCVSELTLIRYLKVLVPVLLFRVGQLIVGGLLGIQEINASNASDVVIGLLRNAGANGSFTASFVLFYALIPILKWFVDALDANRLKQVITAGMVSFVGLGTLFGNANLFNEVTWFSFLFFLAAFLRLYAGKWSRSLRISLIGLAFSLVVTASSVILIDCLFPDKNPYYLVRDPSRLGALCIGLFTFLTFKNLSIPRNNYINSLASHTYGVLLFHANSMGRHLLWKEGGLFDVPEAFLLPVPYFVLHSVIAVVAVYAMGVFVDALIAAPLEKLLYGCLGKFMNAGNADGLMRE